MTAASTSDARKRNAAQVDPVATVARVVRSHMKSQIFPGSCLCGAPVRMRTHADHVAHHVVAALRAEGVIS